MLAKENVIGKNMPVRAHKKKIIAVIALLLAVASLLLFLSGCTENANNYNGTIAEENTKIHIAKTDFVCDLIGVKANAIGIRGTDLGVWAIKEEEDEKYLLCFFGDVITTESLSGGSSALLKAEIPVDDCNGMNWVTDNAGRFFEPIISQRIDGDESTVPSGAIQLGDEMYLFAQRITKWGENFNPETTDGYGVLFKDSGDGFQELISWDLNGLHLNTAPLLGKLPSGKEVVFMFLTGKYRDSEIYLAYVEKEKIEKKEEYNYLTGYENNEPNWEKDIKQAKSLFNENIKAGEISFVYNDKLEKYFLFFQNYFPGNNGFKLYYSDNASGPFELAGTLFPCGRIKSKPDWMEKEWGGCYGGYLVPGSFGNGTEMFYSLSLWNPYTTVLMKMELEEKLQED